MNRVDDTTRQTILDYGEDLKNAPEGTTLSIDPNTGAVSYVDPDTDNPNQYNTMMGYNKYATGNSATANPAGNNQAVAPIVAAPLAMIPSAPAMTNTSKQPPRNVPTFEEWRINNAVMLQNTPLSQARQMYNNTSFEDGGGLPKAQMGRMWFDELELKDLLESFEVNTAGQATPKETLEYDDPEVKRKNRFAGNLNRLKDSNVVNAYSDASEFAVNLADTANDFFDDININNAKVDQYNSLLADNIYGTYEDPNFKRGLGPDVNSGRYGSDADKVTGLFATTKYGSEMKAEGGEINVDNDTLAALIAAGADIEIL